MTFRVLGLAPTQFQHLYGLPSEALAAQGVERVVVDQHPGFPDRVGMRDIPLGSVALLLNYLHQPAQNPFRASHAIYVAEGATERFESVDELPEVMRIRPLSLRAFDANDYLIGAELTAGASAGEAIERLLADPQVQYLHAHYARPGCYAARIERCTIDS